MREAKQELLASLSQVLDDQNLEPEDIEGVLSALFCRENWAAIRALVAELEVQDKSYYRVDIPQFKPMALNEFRGAGKGGRFIEQSGKQEMIKLVNAYAQHVPRVTDSYRPIRRVRLTVFYGKGQRKHDKDAFDKVAKDAIKRAGLIVDDSTAWLDWEVALERDNAVPAHAVRLELWDVAQGDKRRARRAA